MKNLLEAVKIDLYRVPEACSSQAVFYAEAAKNHLTSMESAQSKKQSLDLLMANLDKDIRDKAVTEGRKITEVQISNEIVRDPKYQATLSSYDEAQRLLVLSSNTLETLRQRRDMLVQLGSKSA